MSEFLVPVVKIGKVGKHPNADTLSITQVGGVSCIFRTGDFQPGDLAIYLPLDAVVPSNIPGTEFLDKTKRRIKAIRLRGIYSEGVLLPYDTLRNWVKDYTNEQIEAIWNNVPPVPGKWVLPTGEGWDTSRIFGITKYEEVIPPQFRGQFESPPSDAPQYEVEPHAKYKHVYDEIFARGYDTDVVVTEKLHGTNFRFFWHPERGFMVGTHHNWLKEDDKNIYWKAARKYNLKEKLEKDPTIQDFVFYGEIYGQVQDLRYGAQPGEVWVRIFDIYDRKNRRWLDWIQVSGMVLDVGLQTVPVLYYGPYKDVDLASLVSGKSTLADNIREGIVIKPTRTEYHQELGRVITKWVSEEYKLRKNGTEMH